MIDLGTVPVGHTLPSAALGVDEMDFLVDELSIAELPVVLDVFPRFDDAKARDRLSTAAVRPSRRQDCGTAPRSTRTFATGCGSWNNPAGTSRRDSSRATPFP